MSDGRWWPLMVVRWSSVVVDGDSGGPSELIRL